MIKETKREAVTDQEAVDINFGFEAGQQVLQTLQPALSILIHFKIHARPLLQRQLLPPL